MLKLYCSRSTDEETGVDGPSCHINDRDKIQVHTLTLWLCFPTNKLTHLGTVCQEYEFYDKLDKQ